MVTFEIRRHDVAGRLGSLEVPGHAAPVRTPALLPVINPNKTAITAAEIAGEFDPQAFITNAYVIYREESLRERARDVGVHGLLDVSRPVMTDSGSFQLAEYGSIDVDNATILSFQRAIGADVCTPVDVPTPPDADRDQSRRDVATTLERIGEARSHLGPEPALAGPVQGSTHADVRERAGRRVRAMGVDVAPIGAVVPLLTAYRFADVVDVVVAAKRGLGPGTPVHLFGAGHPMMFGLAAALGCDLFDSAAYALYARDGRYLTTAGTRHVDELVALPCACPVCVDREPADLAGDGGEVALARHNLHASLAEMRRVRAAIGRGDLLELLERRARAHPAMLDAYRRLLDHDTYLERHDPAIKGTFLYLSGEGARRPEVTRHHRRLRTWHLAGRALLGPDRVEGPFDHRLQLRPPFGPVPVDLGHTYPLTAERPARLDRPAYEAAARGVEALLDGNPDLDVTVAHRGWPETALAALPPSVRVVDGGA